MHVCVCVKIAGNIRNSTGSIRPVSIIRVLLGFDFPRKFTREEHTLCACVRACVVVVPSAYSFDHLVNGRHVSELVKFVQGLPPLVDKVLDDQLKPRSDFQIILFRWKKQHQKQ
jgi:hypothetical protein